MIYLKVKEKKGGKVNKRKKRAPYLLKDSTDGIIIVAIVTIILALLIKYIEFV